MRTSTIAIAAALLAVGCAPRFKLATNEVTCPESFLTWAGGLTNHVLQGTGNGEFAYAPASDVIEQIDGNYDLETGDFWWIESYAEGTWRVQDFAKGYGTLWPDGDLDISYDLEIQLADERVEDFVVRESRFGCVVDRRVEDEDGNVQIYGGEFTGGELVYTHEYDDGVREYEAQGKKSPDGTWSEDLDVEDGDFRYRLEDEGDFDLWWQRDFLRQNAYTTLEGTFEQEPDGTVTANYTFDPANGAIETWSYTVDFLGNGQGTHDYAQQSCELTFTDGDCEASGCNRDGACEPPLQTDEVLVRL